MDTFESRLDATIDSIEADAPSPPSAYETKSHHEQLSRAHDAFKAANDRRLAQLRTRGAADPVTVDEVQKLDAAIDFLTHEGAPEAKALGRRRPAGSGDPVRDAVIGMGRAVVDIGRKVDRMAKARAAALDGPNRGAAIAEAARRAQVKADRPPGMAGRYPGAGAYQRGRRELGWAKYKAAFAHWVRTGVDTHGNVSMRALITAGNAKGMHSELNPAGGYLVHPERRGGTPLEAAMAELTPMRSLATVYTLTQGDSFQIPHNLQGTQAGWIGERGQRPETAAPQIALTDIPAMELYAMPAASQRLLDNVDFDVEGWLTQEIAEAFSLQEGPAYIVGDGVNKPRGLLTYEFVTDFDLWDHGKFRLIETGVDGAFPAPSLGPPPVVPGDVLIDVQSALKTAHRAQAKWLMNRVTTGVVRKLTDTQGRYLWQPGIAAGQPATLLNSPVAEEPNMPDVGSDTIAIGFGDWNRTYAIVEKGGVRMLRDPYTQKPFVLFYSTKLVGGAVQNFDAAVFLRFSTSE